MVSYKNIVVKLVVFSYNLNMNTIKFYDINGKLKTIIVPGTVEEWVTQYKTDQANKNMVINSPKMYDYLTKHLK